MTACVGGIAVLAGIRMSESRNCVKFRDQTDIRTRFSRIQHSADSRVSNILMRDPCFFQSLDRFFSRSEFLESKFRMAVNVLTHRDDLRKDPV